MTSPHYTLPTASSVHRTSPNTIRQSTPMPVAVLEPVHHTQGTHVHHGNSHQMDSHGDKGVVIPFSLIVKCIAEFVGVTLFVFFGTSQWSSTNDVLVSAFAHGLTIFILFVSLGHISGGHFNPVITLGVFICGRIDIIPTVSYILCQLMGGVLGAALTRGILSAEDYTIINGGAPFLHIGYTWTNGLLAEILTSFFLVLTVLLTAIDSSKLHAALAIGMAVSVGVLSADHITGAAMNPSRAFGPCLLWQILDSQHGVNGFWGYHYMYWVGPVIGAVLAAALFKACFSRDARFLQ